MAGWVIFAVSVVHGEDFSWQLPPGFPTPEVPADNPMSLEKVRLGCRLFFDARLSSTGGYACASCHRPELAYTDGRKTAVGATGDTVRRNAMSLTNLAYNLSMTWASRDLHSLEAQMRTPLFGTHPLEMGLDEKRLPQAIVRDAEYPGAFHAAFPDDAAPLSMRNVIKAIASFERTLISGRSAFDRYVFDDHRDALTDEQKRGMALFYSQRTGCAVCHSGLNFSGPMAYRGSTASAALFANTGLYDVDGRGAYPDVDQGLMEVTHDPKDMGKFRVPTLRNVTLTAPYMHDGSIATLDEVIDHYAAGGRARIGNGVNGGKSVGNFDSKRRSHAPPLQDAHIRSLALSVTERAELVAFLNSLTDEAFVSGQDVAICR